MPNDTDFTVSLRAPVFLRAELRLHRPSVRLSLAVVDNGHPGPRDAAGHGRPGAGHRPGRGLLAQSAAADAGPRLRPDARRYDPRLSALGRLGDRRGRGAAARLGADPRPAGRGLPLARPGARPGRGAVRGGGRDRGPALRPPRHRRRLRLPAPALPAGPGAPVGNRGDAHRPRHAADGRRRARPRPAQGRPAATGRRRRLLLVRRSRPAGPGSRRRGGRHRLHRLRPAGLARGRLGRRPAAGPDPRRHRPGLGAAGRLRDRVAAGARLAWAQPPQRAWPCARGRAA